ncbi:MAG: GNAT family N-acetyltransferase [Candidatus Melainabacteria bacterium]|nr:MAG: GNAT family N-acetyltransferase [Candidatus Melainabacteria bacterium]
MSNIRVASLEDAQGILAVYAPYCATPITFELEPPALPEMRRRIAEVLKHHIWLIAVDEEQVVGYAYGHAFRDRPAYRWSVETSVYVDQDRQGMGIGKALYQYLFDALKKQGYVIAVAGITLPNPASVKLHEQFAFKKVGVFENVGYKNGAWHNVALFQRQLNELSDKPKEPKM